MSAIIIFSQSNQSNMLFLRIDSFGGVLGDGFYDPNEDLKKNWKDKISNAGVMYLLQNLKCLILAKFIA